MLHELHKQGADNSIVELLVISYFLYEKYGKKKMDYSQHRL